MAVSRVSYSLADTWLSDLVTAAGTAALFQFWSGTIPSDASATPSGTKLAELPLASGTALGTVTNGTSGGSPGYITCNDPPNANGLVSGTPTFLRIATSAGAGVYDMDCGASGSGAYFILTPNTITAGAPVSITGLTITAPA